VFGRSWLDMQCCKVEKMPKKFFILSENPVVKCCGVSNYHVIIATQLVTGMCVQFPKSGNFPNICMQWAF